MTNELKAFAVKSHLPGMGGWGNGYVAIPKGHPAYGKDYNNNIFSDIDVHGGLTYSDFDNEGFPEEMKDMWIVGFDTLHSGDDEIRWPDAESVLVEANELLKQIAALNTTKQQDTSK